MSSLISWPPQTGFVHILPTFRNRELRMRTLLHTVNGNEWSHATCHVLHCSVHSKSERSWTGAKRSAREGSMEQGRKEKGKRTRVCLFIVFTTGDTTFWFLKIFPLSLFNTTQQHQPKFLFSHDRKSRRLTKWSAQFRSAKHIIIVILLQSNFHPLFFQHPSRIQRRSVRAIKWGHQLKLSQSPRHTDTHTQGNFYCLMMRDIRRALYKNL